MNEVSEREREWARNKPAEYKNYKSIQQTEKKTNTSENNFTIDQIVHQINS